MHLAKPNLIHSLLVAFSISALACGGLVAVDDNKTPSRRSYTAVNLTYSASTLEFLVNGARLKTATGETATSVPNWTLATPSSRVDNPEYPTREVPVRTKNSGASVFSKGVIQTTDDRQLIVAWGSSSAPSVNILNFGVPRDSYPNPSNRLLVSHLCTPETIVPAAVDVYLMNPGDSPRSGTVKLISGLTHSAFDPTVTSREAFTRIEGARDVVITRAGSPTSILLRANFTLKKNYNHFFIISKRNSIPEIFKYEYKYWNLP